MEEKENIQALQSYLGLDNYDDARKAYWILEELKVYGDWGNKVAAYFTSILSGTEGTRTFIPEKQVEAYKTLFKDLQINKEQWEDTNQ